MSKESARGKQSTSKTRAGSKSSSIIGGFPKITLEQRQHMIAQAAYYLAEHRGFKGGDARWDRLQAEIAIDQWLNGVLH